MTAVHSERIGAPVHFGKTAAKPVKDAVPFREAKHAFVLAGGILPPVPRHFGHGGAFRPGPAIHGGWGMLGNGPCDDTTLDPSWTAYGGAGDCAWAGPAHEEMEAAKNAKRPVPRFTCRNVLEQYAAYSGYDLKTGANDNGSAVADVIAWRQAKGLVDADGNTLKIGQAFELTPGDLRQMWEACYLLETVGIGIVVTQANMEQFDAGHPWDWNPSSPQVGGHYIPEVGRASRNNSGVITWAHRIGHTQAFYENQNDEAVGYIDTLRYRQVTGLDAEGYSDQDVERFFTMLARGQS